jgi:hypothetical protein
MKGEDMVIVGIVILAVIVGIGSVHYLGPDNVVEEAAEEIIQMETGKTVDLTPKLVQK